jgi:hypothetical protein
MRSVFLFFIKNWGLEGLSKAMGNCVLALKRAWLVYPDWALFLRFYKSQTDQMESFQSQILMLDIISISVSFIMVKRGDDALDYFLIP